MNLNLTGLPDDVIAAMQEAHRRGIQREEIVLPTTPYELVEPTRLELEAPTATTAPTIAERSLTELNSNSLTISVDEAIFPDTEISSTTPTEFPSLPDFEDDDEEDEEESTEDIEEDEEEIATVEQVTTPPVVNTTAILDAIVSETSLRFSSSDWYEAIKKYNGSVNIIGAGGIGSWAAILVARLGLRVHIYDADKIELVNMAGQLFRKGQIGQKKSIATCNNVHSFTDISAYSYDFYTESSLAHPITIVGTDSMSSRKLAYRTWKKSWESKINPLGIFIDARLAAEEFEVIAIRTREDMQVYESRLLFSDEEATAEVCSYKQTSFAAAMIGGTIANILANFFSNMEVLRPVPFYTHYTASFLVTTTLTSFQYEHNIKAREV